MARKRCDLNTSTIKALYLDEGLSACQIAKLLDTSVSTICRRLKAAGVAVRPRFDGGANIVEVHDGTRYFYLRTNEEGTGYTYDVRKDVQSSRCPAHIALVELGLLAGCCLNSNRKAIAPCPDGSKIWCVHHINDNSLDNRPGNLAILTADQHNATKQYSNPNRRKALSDDPRTLHERNLEVIRDFYRAKIPYIVFHNTINDLYMSWSRKFSCPDGTRFA